MTVAAHRFDNEKRRRPEHHARQAMLTPPYILEPMRRLLGGIELYPPFTNFRSQACRIPHARTTMPVMRTPGGWRGIMLVAVFAVLMVGTLAGSVEADRGDGCYRTSCYQRYDRDYHGGDGAYSGCNGYRGDTGCGGYRACGNGGCRGYDGYGGYGSSVR
jgi:hypothetical protein